MWVTYLRLGAARRGVKGHRRACAEAATEAGDNAMERARSSGPGPSPASSGYSALVPSSRADGGRTRSRTRCRYASAWGEVRKENEAADGAESGSAVARAAQRTRTRSTKASACGGTKMRLSEVPRAEYVVN